MRMLLSGPGTGKTTRVKEMVDAEFAGAQRILVLSFTNATVTDLIRSFAEYPGVDCYTLHSYALKINHLKDHYILDSGQEAAVLEKVASDLQVDFGFLCTQLQCITFDAMITECLRFLRSNPIYGAEQIGALNLLVVDEYQDFNANERELVQAISGFADETIILGDDDQSIYGFKDADPAGTIALYESDAVEILEHDNNCYRCPDVIVDHATKLITQNKHRIVKSWNKTDKQGELILRQFLTQTETNEFIISEIERIRQDDPSKSFLVLNPVRFYVTDLVNLLSDRSIDFVDFWTTDISLEDYIRVWWLRAIFTERKLMNLIFLSKQLTQQNRRKLTSFLEPALQSSFDHDTVVRSIEHLYDPVLVTHLRNPLALSDFTRQHPEFADIVDQVDTNDMPASLSRLLRDLNPVKEFRPGCVNVMSIHKSKGLQADVVFINGLVDGVLPNRIRGIDTIEAQRRLLFVGMTRALQSLYLLSPVEWDGRYVHRLDKSQFSYSPRRKKWTGKTSKFVDEMT